MSCAITDTLVESSIFGQSPSDWSIDRIRDRLCGIVGGEWGDDPDAHDDGVELPVIRVADIRGLDLAVEGLTIRRLKESKLSGRLIGKQTILIEKSGGGENNPVGRAVHTRMISFDAICSNFMAKIDCGDTVTPDFVVYLLDAMYSSGVNGACIQQTTGIQNLRVTDYLDTKVAFPKKSEQQRIAAYLDASCAAIDAAIAAKRRQIEILWVLRKTTIHHSVTQGLNSNVKKKSAGEAWLSEVPVHWTSSRIKNVAKLSPSYSERHPENEELCTFVPMESLSEVGALDTSSSLEFIDVQGGLTLFEAGDVLFAKITPCMENGKGAFVESLPTRYAFGSTEFHVLRPTDAINGKFLYYYTYNPIFRAYAAENMSGAAGQKRVSSRFLKESRLFVPPLPEQLEIVSFLTKKDREFRTLLVQLEFQVETLTAYRKSLIHECVTGQRRVTEKDLNKVAAHA